jgi:hypothetical protein
MRSPVKIIKIVYFDTIKRIKTDCIGPKSDILTNIQYF